MAGAIRLELHKAKGLPNLCWIETLGSLGAGSELLGAAKRIAPIVMLQSVRPEQGKAAEGDVWVKAPGVDLDTLSKALRKASPRSCSSTACPVISYVVLSTGLTTKKGLAARMEVPLEGEAILSGAALIVRHVDQINAVD